jgi:hypothetical protein
MGVSFGCDIIWLESQNSTGCVSYIYNKALSVSSETVVLIVESDIFN